LFGSDFKSEDGGRLPGKAEKRRKLNESLKECLGQEAVSGEIALFPEEKATLDARLF